MPTEAVRLRTCLSITGLVLLLPTGFIVWLCFWPASYPEPTVPLELVLEPGARLEVVTSSGPVAIQAGVGFDRSYEWGHCRLKAEPFPRDKRWGGSRGIYDAAPGFRYLFSGCDGISRPVIREEQIHFASLERAQEWLRRYSTITALDTLWTHDGLVLQWDLSPGRSQLSVTLKQICILGRRPEMLGGASDSAFLVIPARGDTTGRADCVEVPAAVHEETEAHWAEHWGLVDRVEKMRKKTESKTQPVEAAGAVQP